MNSIRLARLTIHSFRGAPRRVTLDLTKADKAVSCLLLGDNGTGKSSFVDAVDFVVRGKVNPLFARLRKNIGRVDNLVNSSTTTCYCELELSDGVVHRRALRRRDDDPNKWSVMPDGVAQGFDAASFVLRREDIVAFAQFPADQRTQLFATFLRGVTDRMASSRPREVGEITTLQGELEGIASEQRDIIAEIADAFGEDPGNIELFHSGALDSLYVGRGIIRKYATTRKGRRRGRTSQTERLLELRRSYKRNHRRWARKKQLATGWHRDQRNKDIHEIVQRLEGEVSDSFRKISQTVAFIAAIKALPISGSGGLIFHAELPDGRLVPVEDYFSEANLDLLALLIFLGMLKEAARHGQPKVLVLDDVLQSVDSVIRLEVARYLLSDFSDWQIFITFHDRLWRDQFRTLCAQYNHEFVSREIVSWDYNDGPILVQSNVDASHEVRDAMKSPDPIRIAGQAGILLETLCDWLSKSLAASVTRRPEDKYTLGDTWPGVNKILRRYVTRERVEEVSDYLLLRNLVGAHYNEWAQNISLTEVRTFAKSVVGLWEKVWCSSCRVVVSRDSRDELSCKCRAIRYSKI